MVVGSETNNGHELEKALGSEAEILGKGTFGCTFKANQEGGDAVAVKRLKLSCLSEKEKKIEEVAQIVHENLLPIRAYHCSKDETLLLVYDYVPHGSLSCLLHGTEGTNNNAALSWQVRRRIAHGTAIAIEHLHSRDPAFCHGNIRSSNVFLADSFDARVSEFGLYRLLSPKSKPNFAPGYRAPELKYAAETSQKGDVYSFGVLLLELLTTKSPKDEDLPKWVRTTFLEKPVIDVFDQTLLANREIEAEMFHVLQLAICCTFQYPQNRPSMRVVARRIRDICFMHRDNYICEF